jgi:hypothetical protein
MIELFTSLDDYWLASIGLSVILVGLLLGGLVILLLGLRDLVHDGRYYLHARLHKESPIFDIRTSSPLTEFTHH